VRGPEEQQPRGPAGPQGAATTADSSWTRLGPSFSFANFLGQQRSTNELASYQKKLIRIDDHMGIAIAGLTSDARVLSNYMRGEAMKEKMTFGRPLPVARIVTQIGDSGSTSSTRPWTGSLT